MITCNIISSFSNKWIPFTPAEGIIQLSSLLFFIYYLITKPDILPIEKPEPEKPEAKYAKVNLPDAVRKKYASQLERYMTEEQAYLDEDISVGQIAETLDIPQHHLSMTINIEFGQNFYNYVNGHRTHHATALLVDPAQQGESILNIAFSSGFQSKTAFNKAFKTMHDMTPTEYRRTHAS
jgi:AraC-like DNA-binding protein